MRENIEKCENKNKVILHGGKHLIEYMDIQVQHCALEI